MFVGRGGREGGGFKVWKRFENDIRLLFIVSGGSEGHRPTARSWMHPDISLASARRCACAWHATSVCSASLRVPACSSACACDCVRADVTPRACLLGTPAEALLEFPTGAQPELSRVFQGHSWVLGLEDETDL